MTIDSQLEDWQEFLLRAERRFHEVLLISRDEAPGLVSDKLLKTIDRVRQVEPNEFDSFIWNHGGVAGEIQQTFNLVNQWSHDLFRLCVWIKVYEEFERTLGPDTDADWKPLWELRDWAIDPLAYFCMLQPSGLKWRLAAVAEHALHVANRAVVPGYRDELEQDGHAPGAWRRLDRIIGQVERLGTARSWLRYRAFRELLGQLDSKGYEKTSRNFRNLAAHGFAPRFEMGPVITMNRRIGPWTKLEQQEDGSYAQIEVRGTKAVSYGFGELRPLSYKDAYSANRAQYAVAMRTMAAFQELVEELTMAMNARLPTRRIEPTTPRP
ncbi:MAG: hypothetical protein WD795_18925 [Woeseia sp.]